VPTRHSLLVNPSRSVKRLKENNERVRFLTPREEGRLQTVLAEHYPHRIPELDIALNTGMRKSSQYGLRWEDVDLENRVVTIRRAKPAEKQHVRLNRIAIAAFQKLLGSRTGSSG
jgi:integrase